MFPELLIFLVLFLALLKIHSMWRSALDSSFDDVEATSYRSDTGEKSFLQKIPKVFTQPHLGADVIEARSGTGRSSLHASADTAVIKRNNSSASEQQDMTTGNDRKDVLASELQNSADQTAKLVKQIQCIESQSTSSGISSVATDSLSTNELNELKSCLLYTSPSPRDRG